MVYHAMISSDIGILFIKKDETDGTVDVFLVSSLYAGEMFCYGKKPARLFFSVTGAVFLVVWISVAAKRKLTVFMVSNSRVEIKSCDEALKSVKFHLSATSCQLVVYARWRGFLIRTDMRKVTFDILKGHLSHVKRSRIVW